MKKRSISMLLAVVLTLALALTGCSGEKQGESTDSQITIGIPQDVENSFYLYPA